jgi:hypothetical protein
VQGFGSQIDGAASACLTNKVPDSVRKELAALAAKPEGKIDFSD